MRKNRLAVVLAMAAFAASCETAPRKPETKQAQAQPATVEKAGAAPAAAAGCGEERANCGAEHAQGGEHAGCGSSAEPIKSTEVRTTSDPASGAAVTAVGAPLAGAPVVKVADLLAAPEQYQGKVVRLEGNVTAMCGHRRGWFAVQDDGEKTGRAVRVLTAPEFLVPEKAVGRKVRAEGRVAMIDQPAAMTQHLASQHQMGEPAAVPVKDTRKVVIQATGAEFI